MQKASVNHRSSLSPDWGANADQLGPVLCVACSPSREWLAVATAEFISVYSYKTSGAPDRRLALSAGPCTALCFSHDSETLLSVSSGLLEFWSVISGEVTARAELDGASSQPCDAEDGLDPHFIHAILSRHCSEDLFAVAFNRWGLVVSLDPYRSPMLASYVVFSAGLVRCVSCSCYVCGSYIFVLGALQPQCWLDPNSGTVRALLAPFQQKVA